MLNGIPITGRNRQFIVCNHQSKMKGEKKTFHLLLETYSQVHCCVLLHFICFYFESLPTWNFRFSNLNVKRSIVSKIGFSQRINWYDILIQRWNKWSGKDIEAVFVFHLQFGNFGLFFFSFLFAQNE